MTDERRRTAVPIDRARRSLRRRLTGCSYNKFVSQEEAIKAQWAQVENQLQRRNDLIPNLVETVKGYATHEESVYKDIADARAQTAGGEVAGRDHPAANQQTSALGRLLRDRRRTIRS